MKRYYEELILKYFRPVVEKIFKEQLEFDCLKEFEMIDKDRPLQIIAFRESKSIILSEKAWNFIMNEFDKINVFRSSKGETNVFCDIIFELLYDFRCFIDIDKIVQETIFEATSIFFKEKE